MVVISNVFMMVAIMLSMGVTLVYSASLEKRSFKILRSNRITSWDKNPFKFLGMLAGKSICTASLFDSYTFVSAAHCFNKPELIPTFVALEHTVLTGPIEKSISISQYFMLPSHTIEDKISGNDIVVVKIARPVVTPTYDYVTLPLLGQGRPSLGEFVVIVGYGLDTSLAEDKGGDAGNLRQGRAKVEKCLRDNYPGDPICVVAQTEFNGQRTECGDSGSPLLYEMSGTYMGTGFLSGLSMWSNGSELMLFSASSQHTDFINLHAGEN